MGEHDVDAVRELVGRERQGVLSTAHADLGGWPFGSVTPYALSPAGDPLLLLSAIAEHTKNLAADPRASLLVQDSRAVDHPQAGARATLLARAAIPSGAEATSATEAYLARFPEAREYYSAHDFGVHVLRVERVRWIAGFGSMGWLDRGQWSPTRDDAGGDPLAPHARAILEHMNRDHASALLELATWASGIEGRSARMTGVDSRGFDVGVGTARGERVVRVAFESPITSADAARHALIGMLAKARAKRRAT
jgi:putative heme iron utilization protein